MKLLKKIITLGIISNLSLYAVVPFIQPRSQSEDSARELVGWTRYINLYDQECVYGSWAFTFEYERTFRPGDIQFNLFGTDIVDGDPSFIKISGSQVGDRNATDWLADYFGLPTDFQSTISFNPRVDSLIFDINFYLGLDQWQDGLYFRIHAPVVVTRWDLNFTEEVIDEGSNGYDAGYFAPTAITRGQLLSNFTQFASNGLAPQLGNSIFFNALDDAKMSQKRLNLTRLSEIQFAFGWNFIQGDDHHFGLNLRGAAPTGNRPKGIYLFEPLVGNGHHWELGLGVTAHFLLFVDECTPRTVGFYFDANLTHLFSARQTRTFDIIGKPLSRYMLVERMGTPVTNLFINPMQGTVANSVVPSAQFQNLYAPLANVSTIDVNVRIAAQIDATGMIDIQWGCWNFDFGYNFWARTCEKIKPACQCTPLFDGTVPFALKGDAHTYGFVAQNAMTSPVPVGTPIPLSATESAADIHSGTNTPIGTPFDETVQYQNPGIDGGVNQWALVAIATNDNTDQIVVLPGQDADLSGTNMDFTQQRSSIAPVLVTGVILDFEAAETKGLSNRFFGHLSYNWDRCDCDWIPFLGAGGFIEFAHHRGSNNCQDPDFDQSCQTVAFSQWGIWLKGGISFN